VKKMAENVLKFVLSIFVLQNNLMTLSAKKTAKTQKMAQSGQLAKF
jgi:hypothetical protein